MEILENWFEEEIKPYLSFHAVGTKIIKRKLEQRGIILNDEQLTLLNNKLQTIKSDVLNIEFEFTDDQLMGFGESSCESIEIDVSDSGKEIKDILYEFDEKFLDAIKEVIKSVTPILITGLKKNAAKMLSDRRSGYKSFNMRLFKDWKKALDLFEMFLVVAYEVGEDFNKDFRKNITNEDNFLLEALTRLHARACQISSEILVLIQNGYADGAHARWRTLHEISVIGSFLSSHGKELAEMYLLHENIESYNAASQYKKYYEQLGLQPLADCELEKITNVYEDLISRFGKQYTKEYGWASTVLNKKDPSFFDIEMDVGLNYFRPLYKLASHNIHANPKGVLFKMGLIDNNRNILLAGPSNTGFTDAAQDTIISLCNITIILITQRPNIDYLVICNSLLKLIPEITDEFLKAQNKIELRSLDVSKNTSSLTLTEQPR